MESIINRLWVIHPIEGTNTAALITKGRYTVTPPICESVAEHIAALHNNHIIEQGIEESEDD